MSRLDLPVQYLKNVGPARAAILKKMGIYTLEDVFFTFPRKHIDRSNIKKLLSAVPGEVETLTGKVAFTEELRPRRNIYIFKAVLRDSSGYITAVWFNNKYLSKKILAGTELMVTGKVDYRYGKTEINVSEFEILDHNNSESVNFGRLVPVYAGLSDKIPQKAFRVMVDDAFQKYSNLLQEIVPQYLAEKYALVPRREAIYSLHFPNSSQELEKSRKSMAFEELLLLQLALQYGRAAHKEKQGNKHIVDSEQRKRFLDLLPFTLTNAQKKVLSEIDADMAKPKPMARLVQGDVGSGKTVLAHLGILTAVSGAAQAALMAPTEILAEQHYLGIKPYMDALGYNTSFLRGGMRKKERTEILQGIASGSIQVIVGTHAVMQQDVQYSNLALVVIDEQHRFGVKQRMALEQKGANPDLLVMTATPIPRTLAMTLYGDLEVSVIDELPPGRKAIKTYHVGNNMLPRIHAFLEKEINSGRQCYYVCPLVEESEKIDLEAATTLYEDLQQQYPQLRLGLMHGKLPQKEKEEVMSKFREGQIDILVATTVVEVGVNVPNASVMVIKDAERFGLAQLHQLRGRIGRGSFQSYCILLAEPKTTEGKARMEIMEKSNDGFFIAEEDLKLRGPGEYLGTRQHGLSELKIANLVKDVKIMSVAREAAKAILEKDSALSEIDNRGLLENIKNKYFSLA